MLASTAHKLTPKTREEICAMYRSGLNSKELGLRFGIADSSVRSLLRVRGIPRRNRHEALRRLRIDAAVFDDPLSEDALYWLGFLWADVCVKMTSPDCGRVSVALAAKDGGHVEKFRDFLKSEHKVSVVPSRAQSFIGSRRVVATEQRRLTVSSTELTRRLLALGFDGDAPRADILLSRHFWRGMIDGDGSIILDRNDRAYLVLCGAPPILTAYVRFLSPIIGRVPRLTMRPTVPVVQLSGNTAILALRVLYGGGGICLARKGARAAALLSTERERRAA